MAYGHLAQVYDRLMEDIDYQQWANYIIELMREHRSPSNLVLDLGCGTGSISLMLAKKGLRVIGIDISTEMLTQAEQKFREHNLEIPLFKQDIRNLVLEKNVDVVISTFDTFNYMLEINDLERTFQKVNQVLNNDGLFIFDLNSTYKLSHTLGNNTFTYNTEELVYIWENQYNFETKLCEMDLSFFCLEETSGKYLRFNEFHTQRAYEVEEIKEVLLKADFEFLKTYGQLTFAPPKSEEEKIFFVARKK